MDTSRLARYLLPTGTGEGKIFVRCLLRGGVRLRFDMERFLKDSRVFIKERMLHRVKE